jgi:hypothetical protein
MTELRSAPPKLFEHCCKVFGAMKKGAVGVSIPDGDEVRHAFVWEGHTTKLFRDLELPTPYYTSVLGRLETMGCLVQLSRGGGTAVSRWELLDDPGLEEFMLAEKVRKKGATQVGILQQQVQTMNTRLLAVEARLGIEPVEEEKAS